MFGEMSVFTIGFAIQDDQTCPRQNHMYFEASGILNPNSQPFVNGGFLSMRNQFANLH